MDNENFEESKIQDAAEKERKDLKLAMEISEAIKYDGIDSIDWKKYGILGTDIAYYLISHFQGNDVIANIEHFEPSKRLLRKLINEFGIDAVFPILNYFIGVGLDTNDANQRIESGRGGTLMIYLGLFGKLNKDIAKKLANRGLLHGGCEEINDEQIDEISRIFCVTKKEATELINKSKEQQKILEEFEEEISEDERYDQQEKNRQGRY